MGFDLDGLLDGRRGTAQELHRRYLNPQLPRVLRTIGFDATYERGEGAYLYDANGRRFLDFLSGFGVFGVGRNHPVVKAALKHALDLDLADMVQMDTPLLAGLLAERLLAKVPGMGRVYLCNSGTESVEAALKFARCATGRPRIVYIDHAFHGLTTGSLSVNGGDEFRKGFAPLLDDTRIALGDLAALRMELERGDVAALLIEPIQGKGVNIAPAGFLAEAHALLQQHGAVLICDEVQTGLGRTGRWFAFEHDGVEPDIVTVAKTLSGGFVPIGATLSRPGIEEKVFTTMDRALVHDSTFGGNTLAATAGLATLSVLEDEALVSNAARTGTALIERLRGLRDRYELVADVRGRGLMVGIEFGAPKSLRLRGGWEVLHRARNGLFSQAVVGSLYHRHGILTQVASDHGEIIKLLPPLMIGDAEVSAFVDAFTDVMDDAHRARGLVWDFGRRLVPAAVRAGS
jgi:acetylornithine/succinyldiaminopimelate/putrescine aminotransferase